MVSARHRSTVTQCSSTILQTSAPPPTTRRHHRLITAFALSPPSPPLPPLPENGADGVDAALDCCVWREWPVCDAEDVARIIAATERSTEREGGDDESGEESGAGSDAESHGNGDEEQCLSPAQWLSLWRTYEGWYKQRWYGRHVVSSPIYLTLGLAFNLSVNRSRGFVARNLMTIPTPRPRLYTYPAI